MSTPKPPRPRPRMTPEQKQALRHIEQLQTRLNWLRSAVESRHWNDARFAAGYVNDHARPLLDLVEQCAIGEDRALLERLLEMQMDEQADLERRR